MLKFEKLGTNASLIKPYLKSSKISFCDISVGVKYMWREEFSVEYAIYDNTLILKESGLDYTDAFYYPMGENPIGALEQIEKYCIKNNKPLLFCCIDNATAAEFSSRYNNVQITNNRDWSDYIYEAEKFKTYSGKKLSGQRNHVNKFKKLYPNYKFKNIEKSDFSAIKDFLDEYERNTDVSLWPKKVERQKVYDLIVNAVELEQFGGLIEACGKVVALSVGEVVGDTLIVHVEKALKTYEGAYPTMAQEFAKAFAEKGVKFINREEDCGDIGLRISKLQYKPLEVKEKNFVRAFTIFENITSPIKVCTQRLVIEPISKDDKEDYAKLYLDEQLNVLWGYDYKEDLGENKPTPDYFYNFQNLLKSKKEEYSLAVKLDGKMIGELVLHNFDFFGGVEMGFRFFREYQGKGYAVESASALKEYAFTTLNATAVKSRCFKQNLASKKLITRLGLKQVEEDKTHYYFKLNKNIKDDIAN